MAGLSLESGTNNPKPKKDFGIQVPKHPEILLRTPDEVLNKQSNNENFVLASVRGWKEFSGKYSGYFYIDKIGEPYGATYAEASYNSTDVDGLINSKGELYNIKHFLKSWEEWGITPDKEVAFYCGSGWRAAVPFFITLSLGWENRSVYEGGWYLWDKYHDKDPEKYRIQVGNPKEDNNEI